MSNTLSNLDTNFDLIDAMQQTKWNGINWLAVGSRIHICIDLNFLLCASKQVSPVRKGHYQYFFQCREWTLSFAPGTGTYYTKFTQIRQS